MSEAGDPGRATKYVDILPCGCRIVDDCKLHGPDSIALAALQKERDEAVAMINSASRNPVGFGDFINRQIEQERDGARVGGLQGRQPRHRGGGAVTAHEPSARCARCREERRLFGSQAVCWNCGFYLERGLVPPPRSKP